MICIYENISLEYTTTTTAIDNKYESKIEEKQIENILLHYLVSIFFHSKISIYYIITTYTIK